MLIQYLLDVISLVSPRVSVEQGHLLLTGLDHRWMAVTHVADVVDAVEVLRTFLIVHVLALGAHYLQGVFLEEELA